MSLIEAGVEGQSYETHVAVCRAGPRWASSCAWPDSRVRLSPHGWSAKTAWSGGAPSSFLGR